MIKASMRPIYGFLIFLLLPAGALLSSQPKSPAPGAKFMPSTKLWVLEDQASVHVWFEDGTPKAQGGMQNGKKAGEWIYFYPNGKKKAVGAFEKDLMQGAWKHYFETGALQSEGSYKDGKREGLWVGYFPKGGKENEGYFSRGKRHGSWVNYYENGRPFFRGFYKEGLADGKWEYYFENGSIHQRGEFRSDIRVGSWYICVFAGGTCSTEEFAASNGVPKYSGLASESDAGKKTPRNTQDPKALLDALDSAKGDLPDTVNLPHEDWRE